MEEYPHGGDPYGIDSAFDQAYEIAAAETPEQVLYNLYLGSGVGRDGDVGLQSLIDFMHGHHGRPPRHPRLAARAPGQPAARHARSRRAAPRRRLSRRACRGQTLLARSIDSQRVLAVDTSRRP